jgi:BED zinc finger
MSVVEDSIEVSKPKKLTSWIWQYFKEETKEIRKGEESVKVLVMVCQVKNDQSSNICGTEYARKDSSTGNAISHLRAKHSITQSGKVSLMN